MGKKLTWQDVVVTIFGMLFLFGLALIAALVFQIDGKLLIGTAILITGLANTDVLKLLLPYITKLKKK